METPNDEVLKKTIKEMFEPSETYSGKEVRHKINLTSFKILRDGVAKPEHLKKGDVILLYEGTKRRPCVICKVLPDKVLYIPLTSTENVQRMTPYKSRFFREGCFTNSYGVCSLEVAIENFTGVFDNNKALNQAIKDLKLFFNTNF